MVAIPKQLLECRDSVIPQSRSQLVRELARCWREKADCRARDRLLELHQPLIEAIVRRYPPRLGSEDMVQEARLGFLRALDSFDPERGVELSTYARHWIRAFIHRYLLKTWSIVPRFTTHEKRRVFFGAGHARRALGITSPQPEDDRRVAKRLRVRAEVVSEVEHARALRDEPLELPDDEPRERFTSSLPDPEDAVLALETARLVQDRLPSALASLDPRERMIFLERMDPDEAVSLEVLGQKLGITRERARQLEVRARKKLAARFTDLVDADAAAQALVAPPPRGRRARSHPRPV